MITRVRQFKLKNANGAEYDITRPEAFLNQPDGLGWGTETTTKRFGMTYFVEEENELQAAPTGQMVFRDYDEYDSFLKFCQVGGLVLQYSPFFKQNNKKWFCLNVAIQINKSEIDWQLGHLVCPVAFQGLSYWYETKNYRTNSSEGQAGKKYTYTYPYSYGGSGQENVMNVETNLPSYFKLIIQGPIKNPKWEVLRNGVSLATGKINYNLLATQYLVVDTNPKTMEIRAHNKTTGKAVANLYQYSDFSTERIFALPAGECAFVITSDDGTTAINARLEVMNHV